MSYTAYPERPTPDQGWASRDLIASEHKFGYNADIDTGSDPEDVWDGGGTYTWPVGQDVVTLASDNLDDSASTGIAITVVGVNSSYAAVEEEITLNATTKVTTTAEFYRVNRMYVSGGPTNVGTITASQSASTISVISAANAQTLQTIYTVPDNGGTAKMTRFWAMCGKSATQAWARFNLLTRSPGESAWRVRDSFAVDTAMGLDLKLDVPMEVAAGTDMCWRVVEVSANNMDACAGFEVEWR